MPRQARLDLPGTLHHVIIRGIEKRRIVDDKVDRSRIERWKSNRLAIQDKEPIGHGFGGKNGTAWSGSRSPSGSIHIGYFKDNDEEQGGFG